MAVYKRERPIYSNQKNAYDNNNNNQRMFKALEQKHINNNI